MFSSIVEHSREPIAALDLNYRYVALNAAYRREFQVLFGRTIELGMTMAEALDGYPEQQEIALELAWRALQGEEFTIEQEFGDESRQRKIYEFSICVLRNEQGELIGAAHLARDVTERRRIEAELARVNAQLEETVAARTEALETALTELRQSEAFTQKMIESSRDSIEVLDLEGRLLSLNAGGQQLREIDDFAPLEKQPWLSFWSRADHKAATAALQAARAGGTGHFLGRCASKNRKPKWWDVVVTPIPGPDSRPAQLLAVSRDVTERVEAERHLLELNATLEERVAERTATIEQRNQQLRRLAAELSAAEQRERKRISLTLHDHLQQILVAAKFALHQLRQPPDGKDCESILDYVNELIQESIDASRSLTVELSPPVLYDRGLGAALVWLSRHYYAKHRMLVAVKADVNLRLPNVDIEAFLFQAVRELLFNVVKHGGANKATVTLLELDDEIQLTVADRGCGFHARDLAYSRQPDGGFGLFNIQQRLELLGGRFAVQSMPGKGCRVTLGVPLSVIREIAASDTAERVSQPAEATKADARGALLHRAVRVLIADDHKILREGLVGLLMGHSDIEVVAQAADGLEAIDLTRRFVPDVVVMDISMPNMDGIQATRAIMQERPRTRIVGLSMHERDDMAEAILRAGAAVYLTKGGPAEGLINAIRGLAPA